MANRSRLASWALASSRPIQWYFMGRTPASGPAADKVIAPVVPIVPGPRPQTNAWKGVALRSTHCKRHPNSYYVLQFVRKLQYLPSDQQAVGGREDGDMVTFILGWSVLSLAFGLGLGLAAKRVKQLY